ncbi:hypothetical protein PYW08_009388 [Mythimna loreyi]|uniref:Uncharacterized protein n=1 Tax=Mythimna loreyi TaxID=667449 RepID=A0ACC2QAX8_9NEOP|nr:hypothetical protein PYW08_009388 [Mythimna loreyi]
MKFLENKICLWNIQILNTQEIEVSHEEHCEKMFQAYVNILKCYEMYKACSRQLILYYIFEAFIHPLLYVQEDIDMWKIQENIMNRINAATIILYLWPMKNLALHTMLSYQCEKFYIAIQNVQDTCAIILKTTCSDHKKKLCKNTLFYTFEVFIHPLFFVQEAINLWKTEGNSLENKLASLFYIYIWQIKNLLLQTTLIYQCEKFYGAVQCVQDTCSIKLKTSISGNSKCFNTTHIHMADEEFFFANNVELSMRAILLSCTNCSGYLRNCFEDHLLRS